MEKEVWPDDWKNKEGPVYFESIIDQIEDFFGDLFSDRLESKQFSAICIEVSNGAEIVKFEPRSVQNIEELLSFCENTVLPVLLQIKLRGDVEVELMLDDQDYSFTYSPDEEDPKKQFYI